MAFVCQEIKGLLTYLLYRSAIIGCVDDVGLAEDLPASDC